MVEKARRDGAGQDLMPRAANRTFFAIGHLRAVNMGTSIAAYLDGIDSALVAFGAQFIIHGGLKHPLEADFIGNLVVIAFPDLERA